MDTIDLTKDEESCKEGVKDDFLKRSVNKKKSVSLQDERQEESKKDMTNVKCISEENRRNTMQEIAIQCGTCHEWVEPQHIRTHTSNCCIKESSQDLSHVIAKEYLNDFADIIISDFSDNDLNTTSLTSQNKQHGGLSRSSSFMTNSSSVDHSILNDHGEIQFALLEPLSPIKTCVNLFDLEVQGIRTYQDGSLIFNYLRQFSIDSRKSKSKALEKQNKLASTPSTKSNTKPSKARWFSRKRFFSKRK
jgi:hypothetical protein